MVFLASGTRLRGLADVCVPVNERRSHHIGPPIVSCNALQSLTEAFPDDGVVVVAFNVQVALDAVHSVLQRGVVPEARRRCFHEHVGVDACREQQIVADNEVWAVVPLAAQPL